MTRDEYMSFHQSCCDRLVEITRVKNADYSGGANDPFANFRLTNHFGVASVEQGFFTRMTDKFSRLASFIKKGTLLVKDESVEDTLLDLANYCILLAGYLRSQREEVTDAANSRNIHPESSGVSESYPVDAGKIPGMEIGSVHFQHRKK